MHKGLVFLLVTGGLFLGCCGGFFLGVMSTKGGASFIEGIFETEEKADTRSSKTITRPNFKLDHPGNWKVDTEDEDYDADHMFTIDSPGNCFTMLIVFDSVTNPQDSVDAQVGTFVPKLMKDPKRTSFERWGKYEGAGMKLEGKVLGVTDGSLRIFSHASTKAEITFTVVESCYAEDMASAGPGFTQIEESFTVNER